MMVGGKNNQTNKQFVSHATDFYWIDPSLLKISFLVQWNKQFSKWKLDLGQLFFYSKQDDAIKKDLGQIHQILQFFFCLIVCFTSDDHTFFSLIKVRQHLIGWFNHDIK